MKSVFFLTLILNALAAFPQSMPISNIPPDLKREVSRHSTLSGTEICDNNLDDDGNGLTDCKDYSCYFRQDNQQCACYPMNLLWACDAMANLHFIDVQTQTERKIGRMQVGMGDIAWTPQGKLYGTSGTDIYEINPANGQVGWVASLNGYMGSNALVSDAAGNLFMSGMSSNYTNQYILKYNLISGQISQIANLSDAGVYSAGDLAFAGGILYLACTNNKIAKINPQTGTIQVYNISGLPGSTQIFGIVSVAGGKLFLSDVNKLYSLDTSTFRATHTYTCTTPGLFIYGMSNYNDFCNAPPICGATVNITPQSPPPFCQNTGINLNAEGAGVNGNTTYSWWLPDGTQVSAQKITAMQPGKYKVRYHTIVDTCEAWDTITVKFIQPPVSYLGEDTFICKGSQLVLESKSNANALNWKWCDGSTGKQLIAKVDGDYWLQLSNTCGVSKDTIRISSYDLPRAELGRDRELCRNDSLVLTNFFTDDKSGYVWSTGSTKNSIVVNYPGWYWLEAKNSCGMIRDSIKIVEKQTGCNCKLYLPNAFSPGTQGKNQKFRVKSNCSINGEINIYNRWGQLVYRSSNLTEGWDGKINGIIQPSGIYVFAVRYYFYSEAETFHEKGTIMLVR